MIEIQTSQGFAILVDDCDADLAMHTWTAQKSRKTHYALRVIGPKKKRTSQYMHRVIMGRVLDRALIRSELVDHINHNGMDNRRENLRLASQAQNTANTPPYKHNTSGMKGVCWNKACKKWGAYICADNRVAHLGLFNSIEEAAEAYNRKAVEVWGEFAFLNIIGDGK
jgi:hypothetical protein